MTPEQKKAVAIAAARLRLKAKQGGATNIVDQSMSGVNEGLASALGLPVDAIAGGLNLGIRGINYATGAGIPQIENPVGGSESMRGAFSPFVSDVPPQTTAQRYGRRIGQEVGFGAPVAAATAAIPGVGAAARASMPSYMAASTASDIGAGIGGQTAQEIAPGNPWADLAGSLIGGIGAGGAAMLATPKYAPTPSLDDVRAQADRLWNDVRANPATLTDQATQGLSSAIDGALPTSQMAPVAYPQAFKMADTAKSLRNPSIYDVEETRRIIGDAVAGDPKEARVGVQMKDAISEYLDGLKSSDVAGDASGVVDDLKAARDASARGYRASEATNSEMKGQSRAATSGTGGNEVNATRQNIRAIFDRERDLTKRGKRSGYTPDEMKAMEKVVFGSGASNTARLLGRMSPTSGALPMMATGWGGAGGLGAAAATGNPLALAPAIAGGVGAVAKGVGESLTRKHIEDLLRTILSGGRLSPSDARVASRLGMGVGAMPSQPQ